MFLNSNKHSRILHDGIQWHLLAIGAEGSHIVGFPLIKVSSHRIREYVNYLEGCVA